MRSPNHDPNQTPQVPLRDGQTTDGEESGGEATGEPPLPLEPDDIQRAIEDGEHRLPALLGGPYFIAPDSAPPIDERTMARINPDKIGLEVVSLPDALQNGAGPEFVRLEGLHSPVLREALRRIGRVAGLSRLQGQSPPKT